MNQLFVSKLAIVKRQHFTLMHLTGMFSPPTLGGGPGGKRGLCASIQSTGRPGLGASGRDKLTKVAAALQVSPSLKQTNN